MSDGLRREVLTDQVYELLLGRVMDHDIDPGARLSIDGLARSLGVSATPVREALARLESDRLVTKQSLIGYRATELLDETALTDLFEMRMLLEPHASRLAADHAKADHLAELERVNALMVSDPSIGPSYGAFRKFAALDRDFHDLVATMARRPLLADAIRRLHAHLHLFRLNSAPGAGEQTVAEHGAILDALRDGNAALAARAMATHLTRSQQRHRRALQSKPAGPTR